MYEFADRLIRRANRLNIRLFDKLRVLKFDELNIMQSVSEVYDTLLERAERDYLLISVQAFINAMVLAGEREDSAKKRANKTIDEDWVMDYLEEYDFVTLYRFIPETERKKMRTAEALIASLRRNVLIGNPNPNTATGASQGRRGRETAVNRATRPRGAKGEVDKSLRLWTQQYAQGALNVTDKATLEGYKAAGVKYVMWNTQEDEKVCPYCMPLDKKVFRIDDAPGKQHYGCRCYYTPAKNPRVVYEVR